MGELWVSGGLKVESLPIGLLDRRRLGEGLLDRLTFILGKRNWGYPFRSGHSEINREDFLTIAEAMHAAIR